MTDRQLVKAARDFRRGVIGRRSSRLMCFAVCAPLETLLALGGVEVRLEELQFVEVNHVVLRLGDGRILDPTADQFGLEPVYLGPMPTRYEQMQAEYHHLAERLKAALMHADNPCANGYTHGLRRDAS